MACCQIEENAAAKFAVRGWYYDELKAKGLLEGWCLGISDHPQWFREADDLRDQIAERRKACAWEVQNLTSAFLHKSYANARDSRTGALEGVVSVLRKNVSLPETARLIEEVQTELEACSKIVKSKEADVYMRNMAPLMPVNLETLIILTP